MRVELTWAQRLGFGSCHKQASPPSQTEPFEASKQPRAVCQSGAFVPSHPFVAMRTACVSSVAMLEPVVQRPFPYHARRALRLYRSWKCAVGWFVRRPGVGRIGKTPRHWLFSYTARSCHALLHLLAGFAQLRDCFLSWELATGNDADAADRDGLPRARLD